MNHADILNMNTGTYFIIPMYFKYWVIIKTLGNLIISWDKISDLTVNVQRIINITQYNLNSI